MAEIVYTNFAQVRTSFYDTTLTFYRVSEVRENEKGESEAVPEEMVRVQMSPQHAKALLAALQTNIAGYEKKHGSLPEPEQGREAK